MKYTRKYKTHKLKHKLSHIKNELENYNLEQEIMNRKNYCPYECCDGFLPIQIINNITNDLMHYIINSN